MDNEGQLEYGFIADTFGAHPSVTQYERFDRPEQVHAIFRMVCREQVHCIVTGALFPKPVPAQFDAADGLTIWMVTEEPIATAAPVNCICAVFFTYDERQCVFFTTLIGKEFGSEYGESGRMAVRVPFSIDSIQARETKRTHVHSPSQLQCELVIDGVSVMASVKDISKGGLCLYIDSPAMPEVDLGGMIHCKIEAGGTSFETNLQFRWRRNEYYGFCYEYLLSESPQDVPTALERIIMKLESDTAQAA